MNWKIKVFSNPLESEIIRNEKNLLTGCLTFYNIEFTNVEIEATNQVCEDAVNLINARGNINSIEISNSVSDGLDIDFSNVYVGNITIKNSSNDCLDLSGGQYVIGNIDLEGCNDKGVSIGETSHVQIQNINIEETYIGIAVKDSSLLDVGDASIDTSNYLRHIEKSKSLALATCRLVSLIVI